MADMFSYGGYGDEDDDMNFGEEYPESPLAEAPAPAPRFDLTRFEPIASSTDRASEIPGISDATPTRPIDAPRQTTAQSNTAAPVSAMDANTSEDSDGGSSDYTPVRPRTPSPTPGAFSSMPQLPGASPSAMSVSLRAPYISNPAQYNPTGGGPRLRNMAGGLIRGGQGVVGQGGPANEAVLSRLLQMILRNQG